MMGSTRSTTRYLGALLVSAALLTSASALAQEKVTRKQVSANGLYTIYFRQNPDQSCLVVALKDGAPFWQLSQCVGTTADLFFISNDGQRFYVVKSLADLKKGKRLSWTTDTVVKLYTKEGQLKFSRDAGSLVPKIARNDVRELGAHVKWAAGLYGVPGKPPHVNDAGQLELESVGTVGARTWQFSFELGKPDEQLGAADAGVPSKETK